MKRLIKFIVVAYLIGMTAYIAYDPSPAKIRLLNLVANIKHFTDTKPGSSPVPSTPDTSPAGTTPEPAVSVAPTPSPEPMAEVTPPPPAPTATPVEETPEMILTQLSSNKSEWPQTVTCREPIEFPALMNGKVIGSVKVAAGTPLVLLGVQMYEITVGYLTTKQVIPASKSDLIARVIAKRRGSSVTQ